MTDQSLGPHTARQYSADRPIETADDDRLGRSILAKHLARSITAIAHHECVVVGIHGPWGSGKSSLLNLLANDLNRSVTQEGPRPLIVRFNPWNFVGQDQLIQMFFREVATAVKATDRKKLATDLVALVEATGALLTPLKLVPGAGVIPELLMSSAKGVKALLKSKTLHDLKHSINESLTQLDRRFIVLVDDIDRLDADGIRLVFRLVRLNADFQNLVYVLAFDREVVERALTQEQGISGRAYLEKIVQVSLDLPSVDPSILSEVFHEELNTAIAEVAAERFDAERWRQLYFAGLRALFTTIRDIKRYTNGLHLTLATVLGEVDPVDFLGIEAVRCFSPDTYDLMRSMKALLTEGHVEPVLISTQDSKAAAERSAEALVASAPEGLRKPILGILQKLYPQLEAVGVGHSYVGDETLSRKERRACDPGTFDRYFLLAVPRGDLPEAQWHRILDSSDSAEAIAKALETLNSQGLLLRFVERTTIEPEAIREASLPTWVEQLADVHVDKSNPEASDFWGNLFGGDRYNLVHSLIYRLLERLQAGAPRMAPVAAVMAKAENLPEAAQLMSRLARQKWGTLLFSADQLSELQKELVDRIETNMHSEAFEDFSPDEMQLLLWRWREFAGEELPRQWVAQMVSTDEGLLTFLRAAVGEHTVYVGDAVRREWGLSEETISAFLAAEDVDGLKLRAKRLSCRSGSSLGERETRGIELFLELTAQPTREAHAGMDERAE